MHGFGKEPPVVGRQPELLERHHDRQRVGEVVHDVDLAALDEVVDARVGVVLDQRRDALDRRRCEQRLEDLAVLERLRCVHLDRDRLLVHVLLRRDHHGLRRREGLVVVGDLLDVVVLRDHPEAAIGLAVRDRALGAVPCQFGPRVLREVGRMVVELDDLLGVGVLAGRCHRCTPLVETGRDPSARSIRRNNIAYCI